MSAVGAGCAFFFCFALTTDDQFGRLPGLLCLVAGDASVIAAVLQADNWNDQRARELVLVDVDA